MYTLDQLRGFVAVAEEGGFGRAAERLHLTQPPLSRQVKQLEVLLGFDLFARTTRAVKLTTAGAVFLDEARRILRLAEAAPLTAQRVARGTAGRIRVGFTAVSALNVFGDWISAAHRRMPDVDVVLTEMVTAAQLDALFAGDLDIGFVRGAPRSAMLASRRVYREPMVAAVPAGHPLTQRDTPPTLADLAEYGIITYTPAAAQYYHEFTVSLFRDAGLAPEYVQYVSQVSSQLVLVGAGLGIALVPRSAERLRPRRVAILPIADHPADRQAEMHVAWRVDTDNPALAPALALLDDLVDEGVQDS
jgi:DNA-binding transcriptional LysR family regulator